jgi:hypothetical protein
MSRIPQLSTVQKSGATVLEEYGVYRNGSTAVGEFKG